VQNAAYTEPVTGRPYTVILRRDHDAKAAAAALFVLHPYATDPDVLVRKYRVARDGAARRDWVVVVPQGTPDADGKLSWNASAACCGTGPSRPDDLSYLRLVLADVRRHVAVDAVYALGESNGGFLAHRWACSRGSEVRALVSIAGAAPGPQDPPCAPDHPVSVLQIHGDRDEVVRYGGGRTYRGEYPSVPQTLGKWRTLDRCESAPRSEVRTRLLFFAPLRVESFSCPKARVELWTVAGGGHNVRTLRLWAEEMLEFLDESG